MNSETEELYANEVGPRNGRIWIQVLAAATPVVIDLMNIGATGLDLFTPGGFIGLVGDAAFGYKFHNANVAAGDLAATGASANVVITQPANAPIRRRVPPTRSPYPDRPPYRYLVLVSAGITNVRLWDAN